MLKMKKTMVITFLLMIASIGQAQDRWGILSIEDYRIIEITNTQNDKKMMLLDIERQPVNGSWTQLNTGLGLPAPQCSENSAGNNCYVRSSGIEIYYSDRLGDFDMGRLTITNANFAFKIKGQSIKVGDDISKLASVHPDAYSKRQIVSLSGDSRHQVLLHLEYVSLGISFLYDANTNAITEIMIHQSLV
jgi:hypothetical protein